MLNLKIGRNQFGLLRLLAASLVVFSHAWTVTGGATMPEPLEQATGFTLGWHAVDLFFALSGLLIMASLAKRPSLAEFAFARFLRIVPALYVVVIAIPLIAFLAMGAPDWPAFEVIKYLVRNFLLLGGNANLPGLFTDNPMPDVINIPLWTLKHEVLAYMSIAFLSVVVWKIVGNQAFKWTVFGLLAFTFVLLSAFESPKTYGAPEHIIRFMFAFYLGVAAWHIRDRLTRPGTFLLAASLVNLVLLGLDIQNVAMQIIWVAAIGLWFGTREPGALSRFTDRQDYSYGIYIAGYPVQQAVMATSGIHDPWINFLVSMPIILAIAAVSWNLIEKPALKAKGSGYRAMRQFAVKSGIRIGT